METVFVGNLSYFCTESILKNLFQRFGTVLSAIIRKTKANQTLFYGFVQMTSPVEAQKAVDSLDGTFVQGRKMKVSISKSNQEKDSSCDSFIQTRVSFLTHHTRQQVNETLLSRIFSRYGEVADCVVKQYEITSQPRAKQCGYAYIYFHDLAAARRAISSLSGDRREEIESIRFDCKLSLESAQKLQDILGLEDQRSTGSQNNTPRPVSTNNSVSSSQPVSPLNVDCSESIDCPQTYSMNPRMSDVSTVSSSCSPPGSIHNYVHNASLPFIPQYRSQPPMVHSSTNSVMAPPLLPQTMVFPSGAFPMSSNHSASMSYPMQCVPMHPMQIPPPASMNFMHGNTNSQHQQQPQQQQQQPPPMYTMSNGMPPIPLPSGFMLPPAASSPPQTSMFAPQQFQQHSMMMPYPNSPMMMMMMMMHQQQQQVHHMYGPSSAMYASVNSQSPVSHPGQQPAMSTVSVRQ